MLTGPKYYCSIVITGLLKDRRSGGGGREEEEEEKGRGRCVGGEVGVCCTLYDMALWNVF